MEITCYQRMFALPNYIPFPWKVYSSTRVIESLKIEMRIQWYHSFESTSSKGFDKIEHKNIRYIKCVDIRFNTFTYAIFQVPFH